MRVFDVSIRHICLCMFILAGCAQTETSLRPGGFSSTQFRYSLERQRELAEAAQRSQVRGTYQGVDAVPVQATPSHLATDPQSPARRNAP